MRPSSEALIMILTPIEVDQMAALIVPDTWHQVGEADPKSRPPEHQHVPFVRRMVRHVLLLAGGVLANDATGTDRTDDLNYTVNTVPQDLVVTKLAKGHMDLWDLMHGWDPEADPMGRQGGGCTA